jgi:hypothetical protein
MIANACITAMGSYSVMYRLHPRSATLPQCHVGYLYVHPHVTQLLMLPML